MNKLSLWLRSYRDECRNAFIGIAIGLLCLAIVVMAVWLFTGPFSHNTKVNWKMNGFLITDDCAVKENIELSIVGKINKYSDQPDMLTLDITLPSDFPYSFKTSDTPNFISMSDKIVEFPYYVCSGYAYNRLTNSPTPCIFALDDSKGWAIFLWLDHPEQYLVCSTDADVNAVEVMARFQAFLDSRNPN